MRVLFVIRSVAHFSYYESIIRSLCARGHRVEVLFDREWSASGSDHAARNCLAQTPGLRLGWSLRREGRGRATLFALRELRSYAGYLLRTDQSPFYLKRWEGYLSSRCQRAVRSPRVRSLLKSRLGRGCLRLVERLFRPDAGITQQLKEIRPDVLVVGPVNMRFSEEVEYLKAARALKIPTVVPVLSWDNLTTKGLFHVQPDLMLVWNQAQFDEARQIHGVPRRNLLIAGSPFFDKWFVLKQSTSDRTSFCRRVGLDPCRRFVVYLGSSSNIARDESWLVREFVAGLARHPRPEVRELAVLIRPHPANARIYEPLATEGCCVWPRQGSLPDSEESMRDFHDTLRFGEVALGLNTTGMIDAVVADKPIISILPDRYASTQGQAAHFRHLLSADVLDLAAGAAEAVERTSEILAGDDTRRPQRQRFVRDFVRPWGLDRAVGDVAAQAIEMAAKSHCAGDIETVLGQSLESHRAA